jgi:hypothetical protein
VRASVSSSGRSRGGGIARVHLLIGVLAAVGLPVLSWWSGAGGLAFTMFSGSGSYRLRIATSGADGTERPIAPTAVAARAGGTIGDILAGSEGWRYAPFGALVRRRLDEVAAFSCRTAPPNGQARVTLDERRTLDAPVRTTTVTWSCR